MGGKSDRQKVTGAAGTFEWGYCMADMEGFYGKRHLEDTNMVYPHVSGMDVYAAYKQELKLRMGAGSG